MRHSLLPHAKRTPHYGALLGVLLVLIVLAPLSTGSESAIVVEILLDLILVTGAYSAAARKGNPWPFTALTTVTLVWRWVALLFETNTVDIGAIVITAVWLTFAVGIIVKTLFEQREANTNMIFAAVVVYLLASVAFAQVFEVLELLQPGSFSGVPDGGHPRELGNALLYLSLACLTTMGYGDILPVSGLARPLAVLEGVFGTLYLAVMIARLVGLHIKGGYEEP
jgi:hypothetical protein